MLNFEPGLRKGFQRSQRGSMNQVHYVFLELATKILIIVLRTEELFFGTRIS